MVVAKTLVSLFLVLLISRVWHFALVCLEPLSPSILSHSLTVRCHLLILLFKEREAEAERELLSRDSLSLHVCRCIIWHALIAITLTKERASVFVHRSCRFSLSAAGVLIDSSAFGRNLVLWTTECGRGFAPLVLQIFAAGELNSTALCLLLCVVCF